MWWNKMVFLLFIYSGVSVKYIDSSVDRKLITRSLGFRPIGARCVHLAGSAGVAQDHTASVIRSMQARTTVVVGPRARVCGVGARAVAGRVWRALGAERNLREARIRITHIRSHGGPWVTPCYRSTRSPSSLEAPESRPAEERTQGERKRLARRVTDDKEQQSETVGLPLGAPQQPRLVGQ